MCRAPVLALLALALAAGLAEGSSSGSPAPLTVWGTGSFLPGAVDTKVRRQARLIALRPAGALAARRRPPPLPPPLGRPLNRSAPPLAFPPQEVAAVAALEELFEAVAGLGDGSRPLAALGGLLDGVRARAERPEAVVVIASATTSAAHTSSAAVAQKLGELAGGAPTWLQLPNAGHAVRRRVCRAVLWSLCCLCCRPVCQPTEPPPPHLPRARRAPRTPCLAPSAAPPRRSV